jgi:hypothetical protein
VVNTLSSFRNGGVGFIDWLDLCVISTLMDVAIILCFGIYRSVGDLTVGMSKADNPKSAIPHSGLYASLAMKNAFVTQQRNRSFARGM